MTFFEWFTVGGVWMWILLLFAGVGSLVVVPTIVLVFLRSPRVVALRKGLGIALVLLAVLCLSVGSAGYLVSKNRSNEFAAQNNITDQEFFDIFNREARVPLEAAAALASTFSLVGMAAIFRRPKRSP